MLLQTSSAAANANQSSPSSLSSAGNDLVDNTLPLISIVMPTYNTGAYMVNAVKSVVAQSYPHLELVLADDASSDELTLKLLDAYERAIVLTPENIDSVISNLGVPPLASNEDSIPEIKAMLEALRQNAATQVSVKVLRHQNNLGVGEMRNEGVKAASGDYIIFADSDDLFAPQTVECVYDAIRTSGAEVVCFAAHNFSYSPNTDLSYEAVHCYLPENELISCVKLIKAGEFFNMGCTAWGKIFARQMYLDRHLAFAPRVFFQDNDWVIRLLLNTSTIFYLPFDGYWRVLRPNSITSRDVYTDRIRDGVTYFERILTAFEQSPYFEAARPVLTKQAVAASQKAFDRAKGQNNKQLCLYIFQSFADMLDKLGVHVSRQPSFAYDWWHHILYKLPNKSKQAHLEHFVKTRMARLYRRYCK